MQKAIILTGIGGYEMLELKQIKIPKPAKGEVLVKHTAIGLNYVDIYYRNGLYSVPSIPAILGHEACGYIEEVGKDVKGFNVGDRVAYATAPIGAYSEYRVINADYLVNVPEDVTDQQAASILLKGMTAHFLLRRTYFVRPQDTILVHAAAGGVGQLICQWAKYLKVKVIATVGSELKRDIAEKNGCDLVINYNTENFVEKVKEYTAGEGVSVVYDSVGATTFLDSIECLATFGLMVSYGQSSGAVKAFDVSVLSKKSLFLTRPSIFTYKSNRMELILSSNEVFYMLTNKHIKDNIGKIFQLEQAAKAHEYLEERNTTGATIFTCV